jgi:alpha-glucosidase
VSHLAVLAAILHLASPNRAITFELTLGDTGQLTYTISLNARPVVAPSPLGIIVDGRHLGERVTAGKIETYEIDERYPWLGVHDVAVNRCRGARVTLSAPGASEAAIAWTLDARACDDGAAFRYVVPGAKEQLRTPDEGTVFRLPQGAVTWFHDFEGHYEGVHVRREIADVAEGAWAAPPLTIALPANGGYAAITESALADYSGMALRADGRGGFAARLGHEEPVSYPYRLRYRNQDVERLSQAAKIAGTITSPWHVVIAAATLNGLVNGDIVHNVAPPPDPAMFPEGSKTGWIRPGRAVWRYLDGGDNTYEGLLEFNTLAQRLGFEYQVVEGIWQRWTDAQLRAFVADAKQKGVGIWLWKSSQSLTTPADQRAFLDQVRSVGAVGAKIDFFDHEAKEMIDRYQSLLREAAERRILLDFHGANKPAGESRTWPNELTREGVQGLEHRSMAEWSRHNTTLPFTRLVAGGADYTPVVFGERRKETSWAHQIATSIVFTSPLLVYGAHPQSLLDNPAADLIRSVPSVWDETIVLPASRIGEVAAFARRRGTMWFIAVLNGATATSLKLDLGFLGGGRYDALFVRDTADNPASVTLETSQVGRDDAFPLELRPGGGFILRLTR